MGHEQNEHPENDQFFIQGQQYMHEDRGRYNMWREVESRELTIEEGNYNDNEDIELLEGKIKREKMKKELFQYLDTQL